MYRGLLTLALLATAAADPGSFRAPDVGAAGAVRRGVAPAVLGRGQLPPGRRHPLFAWLGLEDDRDEEGARTAGPPALGAPAAAVPAHPILAPQRPRALASHPAVTPLIYTLCALLL